MSQPTTPFQELLLNAYSEEAERYQRALQIAQALPGSFQGGNTGETELQQISTLLDEVRLIEARIAETKRAWEDSGQKPDPKLKGVLQRVADLIEGLSGHIQQAEREATAQRNQLAPELDLAVRGHQMQRAYGAFR